MTARILLCTAFACFVGRASAVSLDQLPSKDYSEWPIATELKGREVEAIAVALRQFRDDRFSTSGDLKHFRVVVRRHSAEVSVSFFPEFHDPSHRITPARNKYGTWITYFVALPTLKIVAYTFERD